MVELTPKLQEVKAKIEKLILLQQELMNRNNSLQAENTALKASLQEKQSVLTQQVEENKLVRIAKSLTTEESAGGNDLKLKINELIREVDKCLALLDC